MVHIITEVNQQYGKMRARIYVQYIDEGKAGQERRL